ncbi:MAG: YdcF family protein [Candidatus Nealsonbacteria bacterium]|nr:YdcF family protein [Candidatus Nealsonbacteria bacterium]
MKTGVLIHGYNVNSPNWQEVVWRKSPELIGRLPQGARVVSLIKPELIVFGTGASIKDGKVEAEIMRDYLLEYVDELAVLPDFLGIDLEKLRKRIAEISRLETRSKNTFEEILYSTRIFKDAGMEMIVSVSSPDHASRCMRDAMNIFSEITDFRSYFGNFSVWPSQILYGEKGKWPVVVESPSRLYPVFQKLMSLPKEEQEQLIKKALG